MHCLDSFKNAHVYLLQDTITGAAVWEYALQEVQIGTVLRRLLDDAHTSVVTVAAQALAVLIGPGIEQEEAWQAADNSPASGTPSSRSDMLLSSENFRTTLGHLLVLVMRDLVHSATMLLHAFFDQLLLEHAIIQQKLSRISYNTILHTTACL